MRKLSQSDVEKLFADKGHVLIGDYTDSRTPVEYICACGEKSKAMLSSIRRGSRCRVCKSNALKNQQKKLKLDYVQKMFIENGCELLDDYANSVTPMKYRCSCGNISRITFGNFSSGQRCKLCANKMQSRRQSGSGNHRWNPDRFRIETNATFRHRCKMMLNNYLKKTSQTKSGTTVELLGYGCAELRQHICLHPNWKLVKDGKWHIDHIFPIKAFVDHGIYDIQMVNSLSNLQPLSQEDNLAKGASYNNDEFIIWVKNYGKNDSGI